MPVRIVQSKHNPRLKELRRALTRPGRDAQRLAGIEGPNLLDEALRASLHVECIFVAEDSLPLVKAMPLPPDTEILLLPREVLAAALDTETPQPIAALVEFPDWTWAHILKHDAPPPALAKPALIVVLAGLQDPGNLGTILRSAEAFGADGVISLPGTVSAWNQKAIRASAGSVFRLPLLSVSPEECFLHLREAGISIITTALHDALPADTADLAAPVAFLIGNEGNGVPDSIAAEARSAITIPCPGPVESLNASAAASILLYEAARQRRGLA